MNIYNNNNNILYIIKPINFLIRSVEYNNKTIIKIEMFVLFFYALRNIYISYLHRLSLYSTHIINILL